MKFATFVVMAVFLSGLTLGGHASASGYDVEADGSQPLDIDIDFRDSATWGQGEGLHEFTWSVYDSDIFATVTANAPNATGPGTLWWSDDDGYGVQGGAEDDEIDRNEYLTVEFTDEVLLLGVFLSDLFEVHDGPDDDNDGEGDGEAAVVQLFLNGMEVLAGLEFSSDSNDLYGNSDDDDSTENRNGGYYGMFGSGVIVDEVRFLSTGDDDDEYSVIGFRGSQVSVVPLPAALPLYGTGLAVISFVGWRKKRKAAQA